MKKIILFLFLSFMVSCNLNNKNYKYIAIVEEEGLMGGTERKEQEPKIIEAENDSIAYLEAYKDFCIALKVSGDMKSSYGTSSNTPIEFRLLNEKDEDITNLVAFKGKELKEKEIKDQIFSMDNSVQKSVDNYKNEKDANFKKDAKIDSLKIKGLAKYFSKKNDEFSNNNSTWFTPKTAPKFANANGIYCYFQTENGIPNKLRFRIQYHAEDWLFFDKVQFSIDGKAYDYIPTKTETDSGNGGSIWEWFDESIIESDKDLINALANAKSAKMKLNGKQYYEVKTISKAQINSIKQTLEYYKAMGGEY
jgi:hypothetical protein